MPKFGKSIWFLLLLLGLVAVVSLAAAQERPQAAGGQLMQEQPLAVTSLVESAAETQIQSSTARSHIQSPSAVEVNLAPELESSAPLEQAGRRGLSGVDLPAGWQAPSASAMTTPSELEQLGETDGLSHFAGLFAGVPQDAPSPSAVGDQCQQLIVNSTFDPSGSFADPWEVALGWVYLTDQAYVSPTTSFAFADNDADDPSPQYDLFSQTIKVPANLTSVRIDFATLALNHNSADGTYIALWTVDGAGDLQNLIKSWSINPDLENNWQAWFVEITDAATLQQLQGKNIAISFSNETTESPPNEVVFFDDVTFNACQPDPPSRIVVKKVTSPAGVTQKFTFNPSWSNTNFQLIHGQSKTSPDLAPGSYSVQEIVPSGWKLDSVNCSDGSAPNNISLQAGETVTCTFRNVQEAKAESCSQLLVNTQLNIVEFGDGTGTAEPWSILAPIVYYTKNPDVAYDGYSLFLEDGDDGDPSPQFDMFAQGFQMPAKPTEFSIEYKRATLDTNAADEVYGELWLLDEDWVLDLDDPTNFVMGWPVNESEAIWRTDSGTWNDPALLNKLSGRKAAILLYNSTDGGGSKQEIVLFDDVKLSACTKSAPTSGRVLMPTILNNYGTPSGPLCQPPTENPADQWYADRGLVQTGAACNSSLSNVDLADYYTFKPSKSGNHTLRLSNLPAGTEWAAMIFFDQAEPDYAPGGAADGYCRITDPGNQPKQVVCNLDKNKDYFVKVSSGSTPQAGTYTMRITGP